MFQKHWIWQVAILVVSAFVIEMAFCPITVGAQNPPTPIVQATVDPSWKPGDPFEAPMPMFAPPGEPFATPVDNSSTPAGPTLLDKIGAILLLCSIPIILVAGWTWYVFMSQDPLGWR